MIEICSENCALHLKIARNFEHQYVFKTRCKCNLSMKLNRLVGCSINANCPLEGPRPVGGVSSVGVFLRDPSPYLRKVQEKTTENSERLGRQERLGIEPGTSHLPALSAGEPLVGQLNKREFIFQNIKNR